MLLVVIVALVFAFGIFLENKLKKDFKKIDVINLPPTPSFDPPKAGRQDGAKELAVVKRVIDGDTIELSDWRKVRYIGINSPEMTDKRAEILCFAKMAKAENQKLVEGRTVEMEKDVSDKDKYDRLLRYIWIDGKMVNETLISGGFAKVATYPPDVKYKDLFLEAQKSANKITCTGF